MGWFWDVSVFEIMVSVETTDWGLLLGVVTTGRSTIPPWALYVSRIKTRLLRNTRRVLECLSEDECGQPWVYDIGEKARHQRSLQLPEKENAAEQVIYTQKVIRWCPWQVEVRYIRAQIPVLQLCSTRQSRAKGCTSHTGPLTGNRATISNDTTLTVAKWAWDGDTLWHQRSGSLLVTKLVSTVSLTMVTKTWLLKSSSLARILLNCGIIIG